VISLTSAEDKENRDHLGYTANVLKEPLIQSRGTQVPKRISEQMLKCTAILTPKQAIALRELGVGLEYRCPNPQCSQPVIVVSKGKDKAGMKYKAHFEHIKRNPNCHYGVGIKPLPAISSIV
jgi:hypothetical protein